MTARYGPPLVARCPACGNRVRVVKGGKLRLHGKDGECPGSGQPASSARREQPARDGSSARAVSGGAVESNRRRH